MYWILPQYNTFWILWNNSIDYADPGWINSIEKRNLNPCRLKSRWESIDLNHSTLIYQKLATNNSTNFQLLKRIQCFSLLWAWYLQWFIAKYLLFKIELSTEITRSRFEGVRRSQTFPVLLMNLYQSFLNKFGVTQNI